MDKIEAGKSIAKELWATEHALDAAIAQAGDLVSAMIEARRELKLSAVVGAEAQTKVMEAIAALAQARSAVVAAHGDLSAVQRQMRVPTHAFGPPEDEYKPPAVAELDEAAPAPRRLRVAS